MLILIPFVLKHVVAPLAILAAGFGLGRIKNKAKLAAAQAIVTNVETAANAASASVKADAAKVAATVAADAAKAVAATVAASAKL